MTDIDTSAAAVEERATFLEWQSRFGDQTRPEPKSLRAAAATLRALVRERDEARAARSAAIREMCEQARAAGSWQGIADGKDIIIKQLEAERDTAWQAGAEAMREKARKTAKGRMLHLAGTSDRDLLALGAACIVDALDDLPIPERPV